MGPIKEDQVRQAIVFGFGTQKIQIIFPRADHVPAWDSIEESEKQWEADRMEVFAAMIDLVDQNIGRLIKDLKKRKVFDNTLFLFCADNGGCPFERTRGRNLKPWDPNSYWTYDASWAQASNTPFRLYKQNQHEGGISSPLIVHWPKGLKVEPGSITRQPGHLIDFPGHFYGNQRSRISPKVGDRIIDPIEGKSLIPIFQGKERDGHEKSLFSLWGPTGLCARENGNWFPRRKSGSSTIWKRTVPNLTILPKSIPGEWRRCPKFGLILPKTRKGSGKRDWLRLRIRSSLFPSERTLPVS